MRYRKQQKPRSQISLYTVLINVLPFIYLSGYALFDANPSLSRINFIITIVMVCTLATRLWMTQRLHIPSIIWVPVTFATFIVASMLWAPDFSTAWLYGVISLSAMLGASAIWIALYNGLSYNTLVWAAITGSTIVIVSLIQTPGHGIDTTVRSAGTFTNPNHTAVYLTCCAFIVAGPSPKSERASRINLLIAAGLIIAAVLFTGSRKTLFSIVMLAVYASMVLIKKEGIRMYQAAALIMCAVLVIIFFSTELANNIINQLSGNVSAMQRFEELLQGGDSSSDIRKSMVFEALAFWQQKPLIGHGFGQFASLAPYGTYSHCNYTELLCSVGILGTMLFYFLHMLIIRFSIGLKRLQHMAALANVGVLLLLDVGMVSVVSKPAWMILVVAAYLALTDRKTVILALGTSASKRMRQTMNLERNERWHMTSGK